MSETTNWISAYREAIRTGDVIVGEWIRKWYDRIESDIEAGEYRLDLKEADRAIRFIEAFCRHHEGALAPQLIKLELWQKALISVIFGCLDEDGARHYREIVIVMARKQGKTLLAAAIAAYCAFMDGEYGGRIYFCATKLEQACICYDAFFQMIGKEPELAMLAKKRRGDIYISESNTTAKPLGFSAKKADGMNISLGIADEIASWAGDAGLKFYEVLKSSQGARKSPLLISISTAGYINDGPYDELMRRATSVLNGTSKEKRLAPFLYIIDDQAKWNQMDELRKSNPNLGVSVSEAYLRDEIAIAESSASKKAEFLTKYCNVKQHSSLAWLEVGTILKTAGPTILPERYRETYGVVGIDLSKAIDLTSACFVVEKDGILHVMSHFWMPESRIEAATEEDKMPYRIYEQKGILTLAGENHVDYKAVYNWIIEYAKSKKILPVVIGYDKYSSQYLIDDLTGRGFKCDDVAQGFNLSPVITEMEGLMKDGKIDTGDNGLLQAHLANTAVEFDRDFARRRIVKIDKTGRIDGTAALLCALTVRQKWWKDYGVRLQNRRSA